MEEVYVPEAQTLAVDGILHLTVKNVKNPRPLKESFTVHGNKLLVPHILKATVINFAKVRYVWNSK